MLTVIFLVFGFCFLLERLFPGWKLPEVPTWTVRVLAVNFVQLGVVTLAGVSWEKWLSRESFFHLSDYLPDAAGGLIAYFIATFVFYWCTDGGTNTIFCGRIFTRFTTAHSGSK